MPACRALAPIGALFLSTTVFGASCEPSSWVRLEPGVSAASRSEVIADMARRDVVLLGETHDAADHHRWQLHTLAALHALRPDMAIGLEALPRAAQPALERWVRGDLSFEQLLAEAKWRDVWNIDPELYRPIFEFARLNRVPMIALNVARAERASVGTPASAPQAYLDELREVFRAHGGDAKQNEKAFGDFVRAQQAWDRAFAEGLARRAGREGSGTLAVGIVGSGHLRHGHGVPLQLRDLGVSRVGTLLPLEAPRECDALARGLADAVFLVPERQDAAAPRPRLGVRLEHKGEGVRLSEVTGGSLAERAGLRKGDEIVAVAGRPLERAQDLVDAVRAQPAGTWLPLRVRRDGALEEIVVRFPAEK